MTENNMRQYMDAVDVVHGRHALDEGIIDSIKKWISTLSSPVKAKGLKLTSDLERSIRNSPAASRITDVEKKNKSWPWGMLTYRMLYNFAISKGFEDADIDRVLRNPIVTNNMKHVIRALPDGVEKPILPLTVANVKGNTRFISPQIDKQTREYLSRPIAIAVMDGLAYVQQSKEDAEAAQKQTQATPTPAPTARPSTGTAPGSTGSAEKSASDIKATITAIEKGLSAMGGAA